MNFNKNQNFLENFDGFCLNFNLDYKVIDGFNCVIFSGELKMILSMVSGLEPREQRLLFKGKEREDGEYLHMVGVGDKDKVLLLQDPAIKDRKLHGLAAGQPISV